MLSRLWDGAFKRTLAAKEPVAHEVAYEVAHEVAAAGFLSHDFSGPLPYLDAI